MEWTKPADIERESMRIIERELAALGVVLPEETAAVVKRVVHTTADFDYAENLRFTPHAARLGAETMRGAVIVTDTNMALAGVNKKALAALGGEAVCFMAEDFVAAEAKTRGVTRAVASADYAAERYPDAVYAVGNAPTALLRLAEHIENGLRPALVIGVPVGFVNVVESKERALEVCERAGVPCIVSLGRKGGSTVAAAICNALLYEAAGLTKPETRGG